MAGPTGLLRHVLNGIQSNACKYTLPGGALEVGIEPCGERVRWSPRVRHGDTTDFVTTEATGIALEAL